MAADSGSSDRVRIVADEPVDSPTRSILALEDSIIQQVAGSYVPLEGTQGYQVGDIQAVLQSGQILYPWHQFALVAIDASLGDRPVYFASSGSTAQELGLTPYLVRQGLAFRLYNGALNQETAPEPFVSMQETSLSAVTGPWVDVPRTRTLFEDVFLHRSGIPDEWGHWPDHSTVGIPNYYAWGRYALAQAALMRNDSTALDRHQERAEAWMELGR